MLRLTTKTNLESIDEPAEITLQVHSTLERLQEVAVVERGGFSQPRLVAVDVMGHKLAEDLADRGMAGRGFESLPGGVVDLNASHVIAW